MWSWEWYNMDLDSTIHLTTTKYEALAQNKEKLIHELDKLFTHGQMGDNTKNILRNVSDTLDYYYGLPLSAEERRHKVRFMMYFLLFHPISTF